MTYEDALLALAAGRRVTRPGSDRVLIAIEGRDVGMQLITVVPGHPYDGNNFLPTDNDRRATDWQIVRDPHLSQVEFTPPDPYAYSAKAKIADECGLRDKLTHQIHYEQERLKQGKVKFDDTIAIKKAIEQIETAANQLLQQASFLRGRLDLPEEVVTAERAPTSEGDGQLPLPPRQRYHYGS